MKKNTMMRLASGLLVAVLLTTCAISGTFAKYVTSGSSQDSARVAKFGVKVTATGDMFSESYAKDDKSFELSANTVVSTEKVVAPGTSGQLGGITITGTPEVAVRVSSEATKVEFGDKWVAKDGTYYCPIEITVNKVDGTTEVIKGTEQENIEAFENAVKAAIDAYTHDYKANTDLETEADQLQVNWAWAFEGNDDVKDTYLGDQAAENNAATIELEITTTVTQID